MLRAIGIGLLVACFGTLIWLALDWTFFSVQPFKHYNAVFFAMLAGASVAVSISAQKVDA